MTAKTFTIKKCYAKDIYKGTKVFEIRPATKMWTSIAHNQVIKWHWYKDERLVTRLVHSQCFANLSECLKTVGVDVVLPGLSLEDALESQLQFESIN